MIYHSNNANKLIIVIVMMLMLLLIVVMIIILVTIILIMIGIVESSQRTNIDNNIQRNNTYIKHTSNKKTRTIINN